MRLSEAEKQRWWKERSVCSRMALDSSDIRRPGLRLHCGTQYQSHHRNGVSTDSICSFTCCASGNGCSVVCH
jgi:hypothetical protein